MIAYLCFRKIILKLYLSILPIYLLAYYPSGTEKARGGWIEKANSEKQPSMNRCLENVGYWVFSAFRADFESMKGRWKEK